MTRRRRPNGARVAPPTTPRPGDKRKPKARTPKPAAEPELYAGRAGDSVRQSPEYAGEFEQRSPGARGTGPAGEIGARNRLLQSIRERIEADEALAGCDVHLELDAQGVALAGTVTTASQRQRLRGLVEAAGMGRIDDRLRTTDEARAPDPHAR